MNDSRHGPGWWDFSERAFQLLTRPRTDVGAADRAVEQLARSSWIGSVAHRASLGVRHAWAGSWTRASIRAAAAPFAAGTAASFRAAGWTMTVAGVTTIVLNRFSPIPAAPLIWIVPAAVAIAGVVLMAAASPFERAAAGRRFRR